MIETRYVACKVFAGVVAAALVTCICTCSQAARAPVDPGVRGGAPGAGTALKGLTADENAFFQDGLVRFSEIESVTGGQNNGLGPRFRIPTPVFGAGLIESISDSAILANMKTDSNLKKPMGISGRPNAHLSGNANHSANDGDNHSVWMEGTEQISSHVRE
jgi:hypothetical protein